MKRLMIVFKAMLVASVVFVFASCGGSDPVKAAKDYCECITKEGVEASVKCGEETTKKFPKMSDEAAYLKELEDNCPVYSSLMQKAREIEEGGYEEVEEEEEGYDEDYDEEEEE